MSSLATIQRAKRSDAAEISALSRTEIELGLPQRWTSARVAHCLSQADTNAYTLRSHDQLTGFTIASFGDSQMHLILHAVSPLMRRQGLGSRLLQWQIEAAITAGITKAALEVRADNPVALDFYKQHAFKPERVIKGYYSASKDAIRMNRDPLFLSD